MIRMSKKKKKSSISKYNKFQNVNRLKYYLAYFLRIILFLTPVIIFIIKNQERYFTYRNSMSLSIGCMIAAVLALLIVKKETKFLKGAWLYAFIFLLAFLFETILFDLKWLSLMVLIGKIASMTLDGLCKKLKDRIQLVDETKNIELVKKIIREEDTIGSGRA